MRREPYTIGSYVHIVKRGTRGLPIVRDEQDRRRFLLMLRHFNDLFAPEDWFGDLISSGVVNSFLRPPTWPLQKKLVEIVCFCLLDNHFHLLLKETTPGGISRFMRRLGVGMTNHFNEKYYEKGSLFQGAYRSKTVDVDEYFQYVSAYIQVKNCFELFPVGYKKACQNFDQALEWAQNYPYCSLGEFTERREKVITDYDLLSQIFSSEEYVDFCRDFIVGRETLLDEKLIAFE